MGVVAWTLLGIQGSVPPHALLAIASRNIVKTCTEPHHNNAENCTPPKEADRCPFYLQHPSNFDIS